MIIRFLMMTVLTAVITAKGQTVQQDIPKIAPERVCGEYPFADGSVTLNVVPNWKTTNNDSVTNITGSFTNDSIRLNRQEVGSSALFWPSVNDEEKEHLVWDGNGIQFLLSETLNQATSPSPMVCYPSANTLTALCGILEIDLGCVETPWLQVILETDSTGNHPVSGVFYAVGGEIERCLMPGYSVLLNTEPVNNKFRLPLPPGTYPKLSVKCISADDEEVAVYDFLNVKVERGKLASVSTCAPVAVKRPQCKRLKINKFRVGRYGKWWDSEDYVTRDTTSVSVYADFSSNTTRVFSSTLLTFNTLQPSRPQVRSYYHYYKPWGRDDIAETDVYGQKKIMYNHVKLAPGRNRFCLLAVAYRMCGTEMSQFTESQRRTVRLYIPTYTLDFMSTGQLEKDSLYGHVPLWDYKRWSSPACAFSWVFKPSLKHEENEEYHGNYRGRDVKFDTLTNKFSVPLIEIFNKLAENVGRYTVVRPGWLKYRAATVYHMFDQIHWEYSDEWKEFSTEMISITEIQKKSNGTIVRIRRKSPEIGRDSNIGSVIIGVIPIKSGKMPTESDISQRIPAIGSGDVKETPLLPIKSGEEPDYYMPYIEIDGIIYLGLPKKPQAPAEGIYCDLPDFYEPYTKDMVTKADNYISLYRKYVESGKATGWASMATRGLKDQRDAAYGEWQKFCKQLAAKHGNPDGRITDISCNRSISYTEEQGLPYTIVSKPTIKFICLPSFMFNVSSGTIKRTTSVTVNLMKCDEAIIMKQFPLYFTAVVSVDIKPKASLSASNILQVNAYVPGNGPDGLRLGHVEEDHVISASGGVSSFNGEVLRTIPGIDIPSQKKKDGTITVYLFVNGWGTPDMLKEMNSLVFTTKDFYKQKIFGHQGIRFPENPNFDWMDPWYEKMRKNK